MVRNIEGHGRLRQRNPALVPGSISAPFPSTIEAEIPGKGIVAEPGTVVVIPGSGVMRMLPVSVCHHVSTIGDRPFPMLSLYQIQASGLIGSPTVPSSRRDERSCFAGCSVPHFMNIRIEVGA